MKRGATDPTDGPLFSEGALSPRARALLSAREQALEDIALAEAASVCFVRHRGGAAGEAFLDALEDRALALRFVVARVSLYDSRSFDSLDVLVRACARDARAWPRGARGGARGVVALLDAFASEGGAAGVERFDAAVKASAVGGDIHALARAYLEGARQPAREAARIESWLDGTSASRVEASPIALGALGPETAQRALAELSTLARTLGHRGLVMLFERGEILAKLPSARRERAYVVLRELVDNADGGRGLRAAHLVVAGTDALFVGARSIASLPPLHARVVTPEGRGGLPPPHAPWVDLEPTGREAGEWESRPWVAPGSPSQPVVRSELRTLIRASQGLPPIEAVDSLSVGMDRIDRTIDGLFSLSEHHGSVFSLLSGPYGSGKTHLLLHLERRALQARRPVFRLSLEQLSVDLGAPQRHLRRLLATSRLPAAERPSALDVLDRWTRTPRGLERLRSTLERLSEGPGEDLSAIARRALRGTRGRGARVAVALTSFLGAADLEARPSNPAVREDAYGRFFLWLALLEQLEECAGPVVIIDEAENLYRAGVSRVDRRTALRSLAFYCGGTLPRACVVTALTPDALRSLRAEAPALLEEVTTQRGTLSLEDATMFARRLSRAEATEVAPLTDEDRMKIALKLRALHERVRGVRVDVDLEGLLSPAAAGPTPRSLVRSVIDALERARPSKG